MESVDLKTVFTGVRPGGCVEPHLEGFAAELISAGYAKLPVRDYVRSAAHLGRWMDLRKLGVEQLSEAAIAEFAQHECDCPLALRRGQRPAARYVKRVRRFVMYLARQRVIPPLAQPKPKLVPAPLGGFSTSVEGVESIRIPVVAGAADEEEIPARRYTVRLYFCEPGTAEAGARVFDIRVQGQRSYRSLRRCAGGPRPPGIGDQGVSWHCRQGRDRNGV
jgi:hypothetical protein